MDIWSPLLWLGLMLIMLIILIYLQVIALYTVFLLSFFTIKSILLFCYFTSPSKRIKYFINQDKLLFLLFSQNRCRLTQYCNRQTDIILWTMLYGLWCKLSWFKINLFKQWIRTIFNCLFVRVIVNSSTMLLST